MRAPSWWRRRTPPPAVEVRPLWISDLASPDRATRQAAEAAWLRTAREHQAQQAAARQAVADE